MARDLVVAGAHVRHRNPWGVFGLAVITLGIYYFFWYYKINREMRDYGIQVDPTKALLAITLGALIIVPPFVSIYNTADRIKQVQERANSSERMIPVLGLLLYLVVGLFAPVYYQSQLNKAWEAAETAPPPAPPVP